MKTTISNLNLNATIDSKGAELVFLEKKISSENFIWNGDSKFWGKHSPVLFPIVGTLKDDLYLFDGNKYSLSRHGFARDHEFKLLNHSENEVVFSLLSNEFLKSIYPFEFELQIKYTLVEFELLVNYKIINSDTVRIPFSLGAHPAFALHSEFENFSLQFEYQETLNCFKLDHGLISNNSYEIELQEKKMHLNYSLFKNDALIFKNLQSKKITILENQKPKLSISFSDFKNLGLWTVVNAGFICIEPWLGYSDTVEHNNQIVEKEGIEFVNEKGIFECSLSIKIF